MSDDTPNPSRPDLTEADQLADRYMISRRLGEIATELDRNGMVLRRIAAVLEKIESGMRPTQPRPDPGDPENRKFLSGRWHRRSGNIYGRVAEPGSPNAGGLDDKTT
jgi:hypothetical protein